MERVVKKSVILALTLAVFVINEVGAQNGASDPVIMTVDGQAVPRSEFEAIYKKNNKEACRHQGGVG
jgi:hypothetical protein